ncbi:MAG: hypothetical protein PHX79_05565 [Sphaerochaetaceae bacterium]|nr:hypothetical protein [Sphaerochaetaceae bacterium]
MFAVIVIKHGIIIWAGAYNHYAHALSRFASLVQGIDHEIAIEVARDYAAEHDSFSSDDGSTIIYIRGIEVYDEDTKA